jgi:hypothetical protein
VKTNIRVAVAEAGENFCWLSFFGTDGLAAAVKAKIPGKFGVGGTFGTKDGLTFAVYNKSGKHRYVVILANRLGYVRLEPDRIYPEREISFGDLLADVNEALWPDPETLYPEAVGVVG